VRLLFLTETSLIGVLGSLAKLTLAAVTALAGDAILGR